MKQYTSREERERVEAQFDAYMERMIRNLVLRVVRDNIRDEKRHRFIPLDTAEEDYPDQLAVEDERHCEDGIVLEADLKIRVADDQIRDLLAGLTDREAQVLMLRVAFDFDYDEIAEQLQITRDRAKSYKCHGVRKAKERAEESDGDE